MTEVDERQRLAGYFDALAPYYVSHAVPHTYYRARAADDIKRLARGAAVVLDIGCGPGHLTADLPQRVRVYGTDLSAGMLEQARSSRPSGTYAVHDFHDPLPAGWPAADLVVAVGCFEFCRDLATTLRHLRTAARPNGRLLLAIPDADASPAADGGEVEGFVFHLWTRAAVEAALSEAALRLESYDAVPGWGTDAVGDFSYHWITARPEGQRRAQPRRVRERRSSKSD
ncbi:MAG TPA: class I SAM-dependent methyltransferase [Solirubrobacterales bacterium]|nr:class I SAM-dependent methyltransferase [Solirubrobacterales bacterium]